MKASMNPEQYEVKLIFFFGHFGCWRVTQESKIYIMMSPSLVQRQNDRTLSYAEELDIVRIPLVVCLRSHWFVHRRNHKCCERKLVDSNNMQVFNVKFVFTQAGAVLSRNKLKLSN